MAILQSKFNLVYPSESVRGATSLLRVKEVKKHVLYSFNSSNAISSANVLQQNAA